MKDTCPGCAVYSVKHCPTATCVWRICRNNPCPVDHWDPKTGARTYKPRPLEGERA